MGASGGILSRILRTAGRHVDLSKYQRGIVDDRCCDGDDSDGTRKGKRRRMKQRRPLRIGLDVSCWIAKVAHGNGDMLLDERHLTNRGRDRLMRGEETEMDFITTEENRRNYVLVCVRRVMYQISSLQETSKAEILVVFDGKSPPIKKQECQRRRERKTMAERDRDSAVAAGNTLERRMKAARVAGAGHFHGAIVEELMHVLRRNQISFIVSPFEADGQLAYLANTGVVDLVMTEDSDLLCHEVPIIMFKYDGNGKGILVQRHDLGAMEIRDKSLSLLDFSTSMIALMFVCIGCDYCDSLDGIGPVTARDIVRNAFSVRDPDVPVIRRIFDSLYKASRSALTEEEMDLYEECFLAALLAYLHPIVFCPQTSKCIIVNDPPVGSDPLLLEYPPFEDLCNDACRQHEILGDLPDRRLQVAIAEGWVSPQTQMPFLGTTLPQYVKDLFVPHEPEPAEEVTDPFEGQSTSRGEQEEDVHMFQSNETPEDSEEDCPATQVFEEYAAAASRNGCSTPPGVLRKSGEGLGEQGTPGTQPFETQPLYIPEISTRMDSPCTERSNLSHCQQPSQLSESQHLSSHDSDRVDESLHDSDRVDESLHDSLHDQKQQIRLGEDGRKNSMMDNVQAEPTSPAPNPSTQSSRTTNSACTKHTSETTSTTNDTLSPPLFP